MAKNTLTITFQPDDRERIEKFRKGAGGGMSACALVRLVMRNWLNDVDKRTKEVNDAMEAVSRNFVEALDAGKIVSTASEVDTTGNAAI